MSEAFRCDRCGLPSDEPCFRLDLRRGHYTLHPEWTHTLCESCAREAKQWVSQKPRDAFMAGAAADGPEEVGSLVAAAKQTVEDYRMDPDPHVFGVEQLREALIPFGDIE